MAYNYNDNKDPVQIMLAAWDEVNQVLKTSATLTFPEGGLEVSIDAMEGDTIALQDPTNGNIAMVNGSRELLTKDASIFNLLQNVNIPPHRKCICSTDLSGLYEDYDFYDQSNIHVGTITFYYTDSTRTVFTSYEKTF